jgi:hypothetical protein
MDRQLLTAAPAAPGETEPASERDGTPAAHPTPRSGAQLRRWAAAAWLGVLGAAATIVGGYDAIGGLEIAVRLVGTLLLAAGLLLVAGAAALLAKRPLGPALALLGAMVGVALGVLLGLTQVVNDEPDRRLTLWAVIIALSALAALAIRAVTPEAERVAGMWNRLPVLKSVVSVGVLISVGQFWYSSIYLPASAPASLTIELRLEPAGVRDGLLALRGTATIRNTSETKVNTLGSVLQIWGQTVAPKRLNNEEYTRRTRIAVDRNVIFPGRYAGVEKRRLVQHEPLLPASTYFEPRETVTIPILAWVPEDRFQRIHVWATVAVARGRTLAVEGVKPDVRTQRDRVVTVTPVPEAGWLRKLTRGERFVRTDWVIDPDKPSFEVSIATERQRRPSREFDERMWRFYGVAYAEGEALLPLPRAGGAM